MNAFAGIRPNGGRNPTPYLFSLAFAVGVICFPVQPPPPIFTLPTVTELFQSSLYGSGTDVSSISHLLRHFPSSALA